MGTASEHRDLAKIILPLLARVGAVAGGIVSLLTVLEKVSGTIIATIEAFLLLSAMLSSAYVVCARTIKVVDDAPVRVPVYPKVPESGLLFLN